MQQIASVGVVGKQNEPLFVTTFVEEAKQDSGLRFQYYSHAALDVVEEKLNASVGGTGVGRELYLGQLFTVDSYNVYGYVTNTKVKFIIIFTNVYTPNDAALKQLFQELHSIYVTAICNPFSNMKSPLETSSFLNKVNQLVDKYQRQSAALRPSLSSLP